MTLRLLHYADREAAYDVPERVGRLATAVRELRDDRTVGTVDAQSKTTRRIASPPSSSRH